MNEQGIKPINGLTAEKSLFETWRVFISCKEILKQELLIFQMGALIILVRLVVLDNFNYGMIFAKLIFTFTKFTMPSN
jgi:hypothetical protein